MCISLPPLKFVRHASDCDTEAQLAKMLSNKIEM